MASRPIHAIAQEIRTDWSAQKGGISPHAKPYLDAMTELDNISQNYYADSGKSVVLYFLSNASTWRGETARRIKAELKSMLN
jgi:hypothetical protein